MNKTLSRDIEYILTLLNLSNTIKFIRFCYLLKITNLSVLSFLLTLKGDVRLNK